MRVLPKLACAGILTLIVACGANAGAAKPEPDGGTTVPEQPPEYNGPELTASIETQESHPPQYALLVEINCPTGGYTLAAQDVDEKDGQRRVRLVLTAPAADELVFQAFEMRSVRVELGSARTPVQILVAQHRRHEPVTGPFALATTVTPK